MADLFDYLHWRGDLSFQQVPVTPVDALIFSALSYLNFGGRVSQQPEIPVTLRDAAEEFFAQDAPDSKYQVKVDLNLLAEAAKSRRFGSTLLLQFRDILIPEEETQFAAVTYLLDDNTAFIAFRGTDYSLVGWKEDFNMSFLESVPAQRLAVDYVKEIAALYPVPLYIGGHSKGGNLAVYAASKSDSAIRARIVDVYNHDGPGFTELFMQNSDYLEMVSRIHTIIPQSSVIGMLLEHEEPYTVIKSNQVGLLQHDLYSWQLEGPGFVPMREVTADSRFLDLTIREWLSNMPMEERDEVVDAVFGLLSAGEVDVVQDILNPKNIVSYFKALSNDERLRRILSREFMDFLDAARKTQKLLEQEEQKALQEGTPVDEDAKLVIEDFLNRLQKVEKIV